jgi:hypothetical protein
VRTSFFCYGEWHKDWWRKHLMTIEALWWVSHQFIVWCMSTWALTLVLTTHRSAPFSGTLQCEI